MLYNRLQWIALLPLAAFVWTGLADVSLGWPGTLPFSLDFDAEPGKVLAMLCATLVETVVPIGLLIRRTRAASAIVLSGYVLTAGLNAYWTSEHVHVQPLARMIAVSGALLFVFAATQALQQRDGAPANRRLPTSPLPPAPPSPPPAPARSARP